MKPRPQQLQLFAHVRVLRRLQRRQPRVPLVLGVRGQVLLQPAPERQNDAEGGFQDVGLGLGPAVLDDDDAGGVGEVVAGFEVEEQISSQAAPSLH